VKWFVEAGGWGEGAEGIVEHYNDDQCRDCVHALLSPFCFAITIYHMFGACQIEAGFFLIILLRAATSRSAERKGGQVAGGHMHPKGRRRARPSPSLRHQEKVPGNQNKGS